MEKLKILFKNIPEIEPSPRLEVAILSCLETIRERALRRKIILSYSGLAFSSALSIFAFSTLGKTLIASEFWNVLALAFSDLNIIVQNWQSFLLSLSETIPVINIISIIVPTLIFLFFFQTLSKFHKKTRNSGLNLKQYNNLTI